VSAPVCHDPLAVNTKDGSCWRRKALSSDGHGLYGLAGTVAGCPDEVLVPLKELAEIGLQSMAFALPMPAGNQPSELEQLRVEVAALREDRQSTNESVDTASKALRVQRDRIAELEAREAIVAAFVAKRAEYISNLRNCNPDNGHDYDRWQGHAAARRQLAQELGLPVAWPESDAQVADKLTALLAPTPALREDDEFHLHHSYRVGRDLPPLGGQR
jgi:hypothetical protein